MMAVFTNTVTHLSAEYMDRLSEDKLTKILVDVGKQTKVEIARQQQTCTFSGQWISVLSAYTMLEQILFEGSGGYESSLVTQTLSQSVVDTPKSENVDDAHDCTLIIENHGWNDCETPSNGKGVDSSDTMGIVKFEKSSDIIKSPAVNNQIFIDSCGIKLEVNSGSDTDIYDEEDIERRVSAVQEAGITNIVDREEKMDLKENAKTYSDKKAQLSSSCKGKVKSSRAKTYSGKKAQLSSSCKGKVKSSRELGNEKKKKKSSRENANDDFQCEHCEYSGKDKQIFDEHVKRKHGNMNLNCNECSKTFSIMRDLRRHKKRRHPEETYYCMFCKRFYKSEEGYKRHIVKHDNNYVKPSFECKICSKSFATKYILASHMKIEHLGVKRKLYVCEICGQTFTQKPAHAEHTNVHKGITPYVCEICGSAFTYAQALKRHKQSHDDIRQYTCEVCQKTFKHKATMRIHAKVHKATKDFICSICGKGFSQKQALRRHERTHSGDKPFTCGLCEQRFGDHSIARRHMIGIHKQNPKEWQTHVLSETKLYPNRIRKIADHQKVDAEMSVEPDIEKTKATNDIEKTKAINDIEKTKAINDGMGELVDCDSDDAIAGMSVEPTVIDNQQNKDVCVDHTE